ncbi:protein of unknown function [Shewanella benthica]|uniref:Uncharacterized protein n=1 Tax=Shewanella benthica TaxID=43661 RepID=A0A330LWM0_9GAMM|nr:protein of unknown function [Shewanella benthica]
MIGLRQFSHRFTTLLEFDDRCGLSANKWGQCKLYSPPLIWQSEGLSFPPN